MTNEQIAGAEEHRAVLLRGALYRHHPHVRSLDRLGNRFRICHLALKCENAPVLKIFGTLI